MLSTVAQDLTYAIRQFRRNPGFTTTVVLTLALGNWSYHGHLQPG